MPGRLGAGRSTRLVVRLHVALRYDLRCPEGVAAAPRHELYRTFLDQAAYADANGVDSIVLSEHHDVDDGYHVLPIPGGCKPCPPPCPWRRLRPGPSVRPGCTGC